MIRNVTIYYELVSVMGHLAKGSTDLNIGGMDLSTKATNTLVC